VFLTAAGVLSLGGLGFLIRREVLSPAGTELRTLKQRSKDARTDKDRLWQDILDFRMENAGTREAIEALDLLRELPSPLEKLDIPARPPGMPKEVVASLVWPVSFAALSPNCKVLVSTEGGHLCFWDLTGPQTQEPPVTTEAVSRVAFSPDGRRMVITRVGTGKVPRFGEMRGTELVKSEVFGSGGTYYHSVAFAPDGRNLLLGCQFGGATLWTVDKGGLPRDEKILPIRTGGSPGGEYTVRTVAFAPNCLTVACGEEGGTVWVWDLGKTAPRELPKTSPGPIKSLAFSPDSRMLAVCGGEGGAVRLWQLSGAQEPRLKLELADREQETVDISPSGRVLVSGSRNGKLAFWDADSGRKLDVLTLGSPVSGAVFALDGRHLAVTCGIATYILRWPPKQSGSLP
jgi:WD40 repeat protein